MRIPNTAPALLMLLLVTAGLFTMHTLGHVNDSGSAPMGGHGGHDIVMAVDENTGQSLAAPSDSPGMPMGSVVLCVAVLCGLTVLAIAGLLAGRLRIPGLAAGISPGVVADVGRGPPGTLIGLRLADLSVWRN